MCLLVWHIMFTEWIVYMAESLIVVLIWFLGGMSLTQGHNPHIYLGCRPKLQCTGLCILVAGVQ